MATEVIEKGTGESPKGLLWMAAGAAIGAAVLAPAIQSFLGLSYEIALIIGGVALAFLAGGVIRKIGQGSAVLGVGLLAVNLLGPMVAKLNPFTAATANAPGVFV